jgi:hypothetical protein
MTATLILGACYASMVVAGVVIMRHADREFERRQQARMQELDAMLRRYSPPTLTALPPVVAADLLAQHTMQRVTVSPDNGWVKIEASCPEECLAILFQAEAFFARPETAR